MPSNAGMPIKTVYSLTVETLAPLHIGSGEGRLLRNLDFWESDRTIHVINLSPRALEALPPEVFGSGGEGFDLSVMMRRLKESRSLQPAEKTQAVKALTRYELSRPGGQVPAIMPHVKNVDQRPYLPGSSLKGGIRTALAWKLIAEERLTVDSRSLGFNPRYADDQIMLRAFGSTPNTDLLRALHVADSTPTDRLQLERAEVFTLRDQSLQGKGDQFAFFVEVIPSGTTIQVPFAIDDYLLNPSNAARLQFDQGAPYIRRIAQICREFTKKLIVEEMEFYQRWQQPTLREFYAKLAERLESLDPECEFLLQIAWGTGWGAKTVALALGEKLRQEIRNKYRLGRSGTPIFPKSRRLVGLHGQPTSPLGWIKLRMTA